MTKQEILLKANNILKLKKKQVERAKELVKSYQVQEKYIRNVISSYKCNAIDKKKLYRYLTKFENGD